MAAPVTEFFPLVNPSWQGRIWLLAAAGFLLLGTATSTARRILRNFSRKVLLADLDEGMRTRFEDLLTRVESYQGMLRGVDQSLRFCLVASLAFALLDRPEERPAWSGELASFLVFCLVALFVLVVFLELVPSILAKVRPEEGARGLLPALDRLWRALSPLSAFYKSLVRLGANAVGGKAERPSADLVEEEILTAVEEGEREGLLEAGDISMIESIIRFRDREVSEVMTPRTEMVCIDMDATVEEAIDLALDCGHSRIPVYRENKDNIAGILYVKDLLRFWKERRAPVVQVKDTLRQAHFVPESKKISELFHEFRSQRFHIAIILDEFGGTAGLITIEDIIEEIVGEIADEFEKVERPEFQRLAEGEVEVDARLPIHELNERLDLDVPESDAYDTVGGFLFSAMGKIPGVGDSFEHGRVRFEILEADERKINRLRIRMLKPAEVKQARTEE